MSQHVTPENVALLSDIFSHGASFCVAPVENV